MLSTQSGYGSTTLLNCYMHDRMQIPRDQLFSSGVSIGCSMTSGMQKRVGFDGTNFIDIPGLRSAAAGKTDAVNELTKALGNDGEFTMVFVIQLVAGQLVCSDIDVIKSILECAPDIKEYGVVINQLSPRLIRELNPQYMESLIQSKTKDNAVPHVFLLKRYDELEDRDNAIISNAEFVQFVDSVPSNEIMLNPYPLHSQIKHIWDY